MALKDIFTMIKADRYTADGCEEIKKAQEAIKEETADAGLPDGTMRHRKDGDYIKQAGKWVPAKRANGGAKKKGPDKQLAKEINNMNHFKEQKKAAAKAKREEALRADRREGEARADDFRKKVESGEIVYNKETGKFEEGKKPTESKPAATPQNSIIGKLSGEEKNKIYKLFEDADFKKQLDNKLEFGLDNQVGELILQKLPHGELKSKVYNLADQYNRENFSDARDYKSGLTQKAMGQLYKDYKEGKSSESKPAGTTVKGFDESGSKKMQSLGFKPEGNSWVAEKDGNKYEIKVTHQPETEYTNASTRAQLYVNGSKRPYEFGGGENLDPNSMVKIEKALKEQGFGASENKPSAGSGSAPKFETEQKKAESFFKEKGTKSKKAESKPTEVKLGGNADTYYFEDPENMSDEDKVFKSLNIELDSTFGDHDGDPDNVEEWVNNWKWNIKKEGGIGIKSKKTRKESTPIPADEALKILESNPARLKNLIKRAKKFYSGSTMAGGFDDWGNKALGEDAAPRQLTGDCKVRIKKS